MARRQETRPQCLRPYPRGVRGEAEGADRGDEGRDRGGEAAESGRAISASDSGKEESPEENSRRHRKVNKKALVSVPIVHTDTSGLLMLAL